MKTKLIWFLFGLGCGLFYHLIIFGIMYIGFYFGSGPGH